MLQQTFPDEIFKCLQVHESLAFIIIRTASPDGSVMDFRLERVRVPFFQRLCRLNVIMPVDEDGLECRVNDLLSENHRIAGCREYSRFVRSGFFQKFHVAFSTSGHVLLVLRFCAYGWNAHQGKQFLEESVLVLFDVLPDFGVVLFDHVVGFLFLQSAIYE